VTFYCKNRQNFTVTNCHKSLSQTKKQTQFCSMNSRKFWISAVLFGLIAGVTSLRAQTVGSNYAATENYTHLHLSEAIGQPYAVASTTIGNKLQFNQGQILPLRANNVVPSSLALSVFPNPVIDELNVRINEGASIAMAEIRDINGRKLSEFSYSSPRNLVQLNLQKWSAGIYIIKVVDAEGRFATVKFTKISTSK
jgi:hypothetical protein